MTDSLMATYARLPVTFERGKGVQLWDTQGKQYLDALGGIAVCGLGHAHPQVSRAICEQAETLIHTSNIYNIKRQQELGDKLCALSGMEKVFFGNSGAEANEAAIKIARMHGHAQNIQTPETIVMENSFHGRTMATLSATGNRKIQAGFEPLVQGFYGHHLMTLRPYRPSPTILQMLLPLWLSPCKVKAASRFLTSNI